MRRFEVLSPAGDIESFKIAIRAGADAVYFGLSKFNARMKADNIGIDNLKEIVSYAHLKSVKTYVTINTLVSDSEMPELIDLVGQCLLVGVDAFIVQDYGVVYALKTVYPNIVLHGSTQLGVHNVRGAKVAKKLGLSRVVLSREVTLEDIKEIKDKVDIELEVFVQGAMCVCFSGNCYLSSLKFGASGNRGLCKQLCRLPYMIKSKNNKLSGYVLSPRDNCMLEYLKALCDIGVDSFKIEGRLRRSGYVSVATRVYRLAVDSITRGECFDINSYTSQLKKVFARGDFVAGYFDGKNIINALDNSHVGEEIGKVVKCEKFKDLYRIFLDTNVDLNKGDGLKFVHSGGEIVSLGVGNVDIVGRNKVVYGKNYVNADSKVYRILDKEFEDDVVDLSSIRDVSINVCVQVGKPVKLVGVFDDVEIEVVGDVVDIAQNKPISKEKIIENLSKINKDVYKVKSVDFVTFDENAFVSLSGINELRRNLFAKFEQRFVKEKSINRLKMPELISTTPSYNKVAIIDEKCGYGDWCNDYSAIVFSPTFYSVATIKNFYEKFSKLFKGDLIINLPIIALKKDLQIIDEVVDFCKAKDLSVFANNIYALDYISSGVKVFVSSNLNVVNSYSVSLLSMLGVKDIVFSCEKWTSRIVGTYKLGSGKRVLMTMAHCPSVTLNKSGCANVFGNKQVVCDNKCAYRNDLKVVSENGSYSIRRYKIHNCYFELLDDYREDKLDNYVVKDLRES